jgi:hypothetical protein
MTSPFATSILNQYESHIEVRPAAWKSKSEFMSHVKVVVLRRVMTGIVVLIFVGLLVYGIWWAVGKSAPDERPECSVCGTTNRTLQWVRSWEDWYCWMCKEQAIRLILNSLIGEHA